MAGFHLSWTHPKLAKHRFGGARGTGVIALAPIRRGELLSRFGGYVMTFEEFLRLPPALQEIPYQIADDLLFGPISRQGLTVSEYYNHSCDPNAGFRDSMTLVAMRTIRPGEEVAFDYCMCVSTCLFDFNCSCGTPACRKRVRGDDWKNQALQASYQGYFVPYLQDKIARLK
ncbi:MAG: nuclear protein SET [bacterium]|nr:MAG: nuclear protein SET [bacterium]KAF0149206.1 MAG: nuclear protein SET [bacterium]KAF0168843.1 MAG: nuclear protein SET [bacterium]TXT20877.1 MAG: nuclear protein SET [bacterium]